MDIQEVLKLAEELIYDHTGETLVAVGWVEERNPT